MTKTTYTDYKITDARDSDCSMDWNIECTVTHRGKTYWVNVWSAEGNVYFAANHGSYCGYTPPFRQATKDMMTAAMRKWARV